MYNFEIKEDSVIISVNPKLYPIDVIFSAAYIFTDKNYIVLDGNPEEEVLVEIRPKEKMEGMEKIANEFNNELINYGAYSVQMARNAHLRAHIMQRVLQTSGVQSMQSASHLSSDSKPWKEGKKDEKSNS